MDRLKLTGAAPAPSRRALVLAAVLGVGGCGGSRPAALPDTPGARLYVANCLACHQADGAGVSSMQPPLAGTPVAIGEPGQLLGWVMFGRRPGTLPSGVYHGVMPQFSYLTDADLATLLTFVRTSFGNHATAVTPPMVAAARAAHAAH